MVREIIKCPYCHCTISYRSKSYVDYNNIIGPEQQSCPYCKKIYLTGKKSINNISIKEIKRFRNHNIFWQTLTLVFIIDLILFIPLSDLLDKLYESTGFGNYIEEYTMVPIIVILCLIDVIIFLLIKKYQYGKASYYLQQKIELEDEKNKNTNTNNESSNVENKNEKINCGVYEKEILKKDSINGLCQECDEEISKEPKEKNKTTNISNDTVANTKSFCTNCGKEVELNWTFCRHCGNKI